MPASVSGQLPDSACDASRALVHDRVALDEIELCCELMIAASTEASERLSAARIDEVLRVQAPNVPRQRRRLGCGGGEPSGAELGVER
ncbi:hypothetical protein [Streptomyces sp. TR06-5]|uniref:hypothetical protein n=1 Tax=unclassified Streptomyces TaxID=2593676 RepID=UPI00399F379A